MTVETTRNKITYVGNGTTTVFPYDFKIFADADLVVTEILIADPFTQTVKTITTDYTVSGAGDATGGNVTMVTAPASTVRLVIQRVLDLEQTLDLVENDPSPAQTREEAWDKNLMRIQQIQEEIGRSLKIPIDISGVSVELPPPEADKTPTWNSTATALENVTNPGVAAEEAAASAAAALASETAAAASATAAAASAAAAAASAAEAEPSAFAVGSFTRDTALAGGTQAVTGVGFQPRTVILMTVKDATKEASIGFDIQTAREVLTDNYNASADTWTTGSTRSVFVIQTGGTNIYTGRINSFDADGLTMRWFKSSLPTGTIKVMYLAMR